MKDAGLYEMRDLFKYYDNIKGEPEFIYPAHLFINPLNFSLLVISLYARSISFLNPL